MEMRAEGWPADFAWDAEAASVLDRIDRAFGPVARPTTFTDVNHCCECREHDEELSVRPRMELQRADLGGAAWDPICFTSAQGVAYLFPILARYAMAPSLWPDWDWYGEQMVFHLRSQKPQDDILSLCTGEQRAAVAGMIAWIIAHRVAEIEDYHSTDDWLDAARLWSA